MRQIDIHCNHISIGNQANLRLILPFIFNNNFFKLHRYHFQACFLPPCKCKCKDKIHLFFFFFSSHICKHTSSAKYLAAGAPLVSTSAMQTASSRKLARYFATCQLTISHRLASDDFKKRKNNIQILPFFECHSCSWLQFPLLDGCWEKMWLWVSSAPHW